MPTKEDPKNAALKHGDIHGATPQTTPRSCTDFCWIVIFCVFTFGGIGLCYWKVESKGQLKELRYGFPDSTGEVCGYGANKDNNYLYICPLGGAFNELNYNGLTCVAECPSDAHTSIECCTKGGDCKDLDSYPTTPMAVFCMPSDLNSPQLALVKKTLGGNRIFEVFLKVLEACRNPQPLMVAAGVAVALSFLYLLLIDLLALPLVYIGIAVMSITPSAIGGYFIWASQHAGKDPQGDVFTLGSAQQDLYTGIGCCAVSALFICVMCTKMKSIDQAVSSIQQATECMMTMPLLMIEPLLALVIKLVVMSGLLFGLLTLLLSCQNTEGFDLRDPAKSYNLDNPWILCLVFYVFMMIWVWELCHAVSQYVVIHCAEIWYFREHVNGKKRQGCCLALQAPSTLKEMVRGFCHATTYHLGSLLAGSFLVAVFSGIRWVAVFLTTSSQVANNPVAACVGRVISCCLSCITWIVNFVNKMAYMSVAMNSDTYFQGCREVMSLVYNYGSALATTEGFASLFSFVGTGSVAAGTGATMWFIASHAKVYNDPGSKHYVSDPAALAIAAAIIGGVLSLGFMLIFDTIADTMFYCEVVSKKRKEVGISEDPQQSCFSCGVFGSSSPPAEAQSLLRSK